MIASLAPAAEERVDEKALFAGSIAEGVVWVDYFSGLMLSKGGEAARQVWPGNVGFAAMAGDRLALVSGDNLATFKPGSWTPQETLVGKWITALAGSPDTAIAFDETSAVWRLEKDGRWQPHASGIKDSVLGVAYSNGLWVAVGGTREKDEEYESARPAEFSRPYWVVQEQEPRLWWSNDGITWAQGVLPKTGYNKFMAVAGSPDGWVAVAADGRAFGSRDGKQWQPKGEVAKLTVEYPITLRALGGFFWVRVNEQEPWQKSADGKSWSRVPLSAGATIDTLLLKDGKVHAIGTRKPGRRIEVATVEAFAEAPPLNAAELAAKAAADEKIRVAAAEKAAVAKKTADAKAQAATQAAAAKALNERKAAEARTLAVEAWAGKLAAWDVAMTQAKDTATRLKLTRALHADWKAAHPGYTQAQVLAYLAPLFDRVTGYEVSDASVFGFMADAIDFSEAVVTAFTHSLPNGTVALVKGLAQDRIAINRAQQQRLKPPVLPARIKTKSNPPGAVRSYAVMDIAAVRLLAAGGDAAAAYDLGTAYSRGQGVPADSIASRFWIQLAQNAGLEIPTYAKGDLAAQAAFWRRLGEQGSRMGLYLHGYMLREGQGGPPDLEAAHVAFKKAAAAGQREAMVALAQQYRTGQGADLDLDAARKALEEGAAHDYPPAVAELGWMYEAAAGVPRDLTKAAGFYRRAAEQGYVWAMNRYANFLFAGHGIPKDEAAARPWMQKAAAQGDTGSKTAIAAIAAGKYEPPRLALYVPAKQLRPLFDVAKRRQQAEAGDAAACYDLAYAHWQGLGVRQNNPEGMRWFERAKAAGWQVVEAGSTAAETRALWQRYAEQGSIVALGKVALVTYPHTPEAVATIRRAADAGSAVAQRLLAGRYRDGLGVKADQAEANAWMRRAAELGEAEAQVMLGYAYEFGQGLPKDHTEATRWYRLGAEGDSRIGMANLANQLTQGLGVAANQPEAASWYLKLAGLPAEPVSPAEAATRIRAKVEEGDASAYAVWGIMLRRGFGVPLNNDAGFAYGFAAANIGQPIYQLSWFESAGLRRAPALRQAAGLLTKAFDYILEEKAEDPAYAEKLERGELPTLEAIFKLARPENAIAVRVLRGIEDGSLDLALAREAGQSHEPFKINGLIPLVSAATERTELAGQPWLLRLAGVATPAADAAAVEKLFQAALLAPETDADATARLQALRRLAAARLYYGIGRAADRPAALAWALLSISNADSLFAVDLLSRELNPDQIASAEELYQRITARLTPASK